MTAPWTPTATARSRDLAARLGSPCRDIARRTTTRGSPGRRPGHRHADPPTPTRVSRSPGSIATTRPSRPASAAAVSRARTGLTRRCAAGAARQGRSRCARGLLRDRRRRTGCRCDPGTEFAIPCGSAVTPQHHPATGQDRTSARRARGRAGRRRAVAPEPFEGVVRALLSVLHVHDEVEVVQQHPALVTLTLAMHWLGAEFAQSLLDRVDDRPAPVVRCGAEQSRKMSAIDNWSLTSNAMMSSANLSAAAVGGRLGQGHRLSSSSHRLLEVRSLEHASGLSRLVVRTQDHDDVGHGRALVMAPYRRFRQPSASATACSERDRRWSGVGDRRRRSSCSRSGWRCRRCGTGSPGLAAAVAASCSRPGVPTPFCTSTVICSAPQRRRARARTARSRGAVRRLCRRRDERGIRVRRSRQRRGGQRLEAGFTAAGDIAERRPGSRQLLAVGPVTSRRPWSWSAARSASACCQAVGG